MTLLSTIPSYIYGIGHRKNNEDFIYPLPDTATVASRLFIVCDGVGGHSEGEVASRIVCHSFAEYCEKNSKPDIDDSFWIAALQYAESAMQAYIEQHDQSRDMATTLVFLYLHTNSPHATVGHIGDSRLYHFRNNTIAWHTSDHSYVNALVEQGLLTEEQALRHPQRNVISRAIRGALFPAKLELNTLPIQTSDSFLLCSDGFLEANKNDDLERIWQTAASQQARKEAMEAACLKNSKDNYSAYLVSLPHKKGILSAIRTSSLMGWLLS